MYRHVSLDSLITLSTMMRASGRSALTHSKTIAPPAAGGSSPTHWPHTRKTSWVLIPSRLNRSRIAGRGFLASRSRTGRLDVARPLDGRIDNARGGWKGKGIYSPIATRAPFHMEGGKGTTSKLMKFQMRSDPLAN